MSTPFSTQIENSIEAWRSAMECGPDSGRAMRADKTLELLITFVEMRIERKELDLVSKAYNASNPDMGEHFFTCFGFQVFLRASVVGRCCHSEYHLDLRVWHPSNRIVVGARAEYDWLPEKTVVKRASFSIGFNSLPALNLFNLFDEIRAF